MSLNLRALAQFLRDVAASAFAHTLGDDVCRHCDPDDDDLTAVMDATRETEVAQMERTPIGDAAWRAAIDRACRIEAAVDDFAAEIAACADRELAELVERGES